MKIRFRPATVADAQALTDLSDFDSLPNDVASWQAFLRNPKESAVWLVTAEEPAGFLVLSAVGAGHPAPLRIDAIFLTDTIRSQGYGRALLEYASADVPAYVEHPGLSAPFFLACGFSTETGSDRLVRR